jgi:hypothetical protein
VRKLGTGTLTKSTSSGEGEMDHGATWPPSPSPFVSSSQYRGIGSQQTGPLVGERQPKHFKIASGPPSGLFEQPPSALVAFEHERRKVPSRLQSRWPPRTRGPLPKKARTKGCPPSSARYVYVDGGLLSATLGA